MRAALFLFAITLVVYSHAEDCPTNNVATECTHITCSPDFHKACVQNVCTCNPNQGSFCTHQANCTVLPNCNRVWHCVDNGCRCGGFGFGK